MISCISMIFATITFAFVGEKGKGGKYQTVNSI